MNQEFLSNSNIFIFYSSLIYYKSLYSCKHKIEKFYKVPTISGDQKTLCWFNLFISHSNRISRHLEFQDITINRRPYFPDSSYACLCHLYLHPMLTCVTDIFTLCSLVSLISSSYARLCH